MGTYYVRNINMGYYGRLTAGNLKQLAKEKKGREDYSQQKTRYSKAERLGKLGSSLSKEGVFQNS